MENSANINIIKIKVVFAGLIILASFLIFGLNPNVGESTTTFIYFANGGAMGFLFGNTNVPAKKS